MDVDKAEAYHSEALRGENVRTNYQQERKQGE